MIVALDRSPKVATANYCHPQNLCPATDNQLSAATSSRSETNNQLVYNQEQTQQNTIVNSQLRGRVGDILQVLISQLYPLVSGVGGKEVGEVVVEGLGDSD